MIPRWFERLGVLALLLLAFFLRVWQLPALPAGFSQEEITSIDITQQIQNGAGQVFFRTGEQTGEESFYHTLNAGVTQWVGDGLIGYRMLSVWAGLLTLAFLYRTAHWLFGTGIALVALAIMVTDIEAVMLARSATRLTLMPLFTTATLAFIAWTFRLHESIRPFKPRTLRFSVLGYVVGAALYVHYTGGLLGIILILFIVYLWQTHQPVSRQIWSSCLFALTLIAILGLPYLISFLRNPDASGIYIFWKDRPQTLLEFFESLVSTLGAFFITGDDNPVHNIPALPLLWPFWSLLVLIGVYTAFQRWREPHFGLLLIGLLVGLVPDIWLRGSTDFSAMMIVLPIVAILGGVGAYRTAIYMRFQSQNGLRLVAALLVVGFAWTIYRVYQDYFQNWPDRQDVRLAYHTDLANMVAYLEKSDHPLPTLICTNLLRTEKIATGEIRWSDPQLVENMLHREDLALRFADCRTAFVLINGGQPMQVLEANAGEIPGDAAQQWLQYGEVTQLADTGRVTLLDIEDELAQFGGRLQLETPLLYPYLDGQPQQVKMPVRFGRNVTLVGYRAPDISTYHRGDVVAITTYWRVDGQLPDHLGFFTRLHNNPLASPITEVNVVDVLTENLRTDDILVQASLFTIPEDLPTGEYIVTLGAYDNNTLNQIIVFSENDTNRIVPRGNYLMLAPRLVVD